MTGPGPGPETDDGHPAAVVAGLVGHVLDLAATARLSPELPEPGGIHAIRRARYDAGDLAA